MDINEDNGRYPSNPYGVDHQPGYSYLKHQKALIRNIPYSRPIENQYDVDDDDDDDDVDLGEEEENCNQNNGVMYVGKDMDDDDDDDDNEELDGGNEDEDGYNENGDQQKGYDRKNDDVDLKRHPKKRKLKSLLSSYEFAPRVPAPAVSAPVPKPSHGGRNFLTDWTESETFVLLDAWGELFLQRGRKSLRSKEWQEVAEKVSEASKIERTDTQCRNRLDTLKKKYKKEKVMLAEIGVTSSKWVYFKKMDMLMSPPQQGGVSCRLDSGEYVSMNPRNYLNHANGLDEMRDSPAVSGSAGSEEDDSDGLPPKKRKFKRRYDEGASFGLLADMIQKFSNIYEKIEKNKMQQMSGLEKMRKDFHRELEKQNQQIMERAQAEIAKIHQQADDDKNTSG